LGEAVGTNDDEGDIDVDAGTRRDVNGDATDVGGANVAEDDVNAGDIGKVDDVDSGDGGGGSRGSAHFLSNSSAELLQLQSQQQQVECTACNSYSKKQTRTLTHTHSGQLSYRIR
jgi:hypothetical protein